MDKLGDILKVVQQFPEQTIALVLFVVLAALLGKGRSVKVGGNNHGMINTGNITNMPSWLLAIIVVGLFITIWLVLSVFAK